MQANSTKPKWLIPLLMAVILLIGGYYRFVGLNWDDYTHLHPDERFLTQVLAALDGELSYALAPASDPVSQERYNFCLSRYPNTNGRGGYFDAKCSTLNPNNIGFGLYVYGTLPLFIANVASDAYSELAWRIPLWWQDLRGMEPDTTRLMVDASVWQGYFGGHIVWRALNGMADLWTVLLLFFIGRRMHNHWVGLVADALYAASPLAIQIAHFATVNSMATFFATLCMYFALRVQDESRWRDYIMFGVVLAAAVASRINLAPIAGIVALAALVRLLPTLDQRLAWGERERVLSQNVIGVVIAAVVSIIGFRLFQPYAFTGPGFFGLLPNSEWLANISEAQTLVSGAAESPPNWQWISRTAYLFPATNMVLWGMGVAFGLTAFVAWVWAAIRLVSARDNALRNLLPVVWIFIYYAWIGDLWVMTMRYYLPLYPLFALLAAWFLVSLVQGALRPSSSALRRNAVIGLTVFVIGFTHVWALMFTNIYRNQLTRVQASHYVWEQIPGDFSMEIEGAPDGTPLVNIALRNRLGTDAEIDTQATLLDIAGEYVREFVAPADGTITSVTVPHLGELVADDEEESVRVWITTKEADGLLTQGTLTGNFSRDKHVIGDTYEIEFEIPITIEAGERYVFNASVESEDSLLISGAIVSHEGDWDDPVPTIVCTMPQGITLADSPPPGLNTVRDCSARNAWDTLINGYGLNMAYEDVDFKRDHLKLALGNSDYIIISSNRFYDSLSRIEARWPMSNAYYDALFSGELGFELERVFDESFELGPLRVRDQHLPHYDAPAWFNRLEAEEAFHVYDHPAVFVFRKTEDYSDALVASVLDSVVLQRAGEVPPGSYNSPDIIGIDVRPSLAADEAPNHLLLEDDARELQYSGPAWSNRFDRESWVNTNPVVTVVAWWLTIVVFGLMAWPLLFAIFPGLVDRGYSFAKITGLLLVGWFAWFWASLRVPLWSQFGVAFSLILLGGASFWLARRNWAELREYLRMGWTRMVVIDILTLGLFLAFLGVRLTNPDLWHPAFGGEKPMDFAYFNGVLRSTVFPPIDPWFAGGYINYYYFGFVVVGSPVLLLGVVPSVAYNLIIPTLFALTGMGAFGVAFNLVAGARDRSPAVRLRGNPWIAGIAALLLAVVLGNLNTPRVFFNGVAQMGGHEPVGSLTEFLVDQHALQNGQQPNDQDVFLLSQRADENRLTDRVRYQFAQARSAVFGLARGIGELARGNLPFIASNRWYWASSRVIAEPPVDGGGGITEMPYFTFLYGDLHAHMMSMPMQFLVMVFLLNELLLAKRDHRRRWESAIAIGLGGMTVGMLFATNTWEWPTYMALGTLGLGFAWWMHWESFSRASIVSMILKIGGFLALSVWLSRPYTHWYASTYSSVELYQGNRTPIWAYLIIHGLFLYLLVSLLAWETHRWLSHVRVSALRGRATALITVLGIAGAAILLVLAITLLGYPVVLIAIPLIFWVGVIFFRPGQTKPMQFVLALAGLALTLTVFVEVATLAGDIQRMNTVFKFYLQVWLLFSVVGGAAFAWLFYAALDWNASIRSGWVTALSVLFAVAALYPIMATRARAIDRMAADTPLTLDGMEYMRHAERYEVVDSFADRAEVFPLEPDYHLIRWLQDNIDGVPVIMEAQSEREYLWGSRIAIYTGMPSIVGWNWHQVQQRTFTPMPQMVRQRAANVNYFYTTTDIPVAARILDHYNVEYIIVGVLERARYPRAGLDKFETMTARGALEVVYEVDDVRVYRVNSDQVTQLALEAVQRDEIVRVEE